MVIDSGATVHLSDNFVEELDGVEMNLPAGDYRAIPVGLGPETTANDDADRYMLLPVGRERVHQLSAEALQELTAHEQVEVKSAA